MTKEAIKSEIDRADYFAVIADETTDVSVKNQMATILRYVHGGEVKERFMGFDNVSGLKGIVSIVLQIFGFCIHLYCSYCQETIDMEYEMYYLSTM